MLDFIAHNNNLAVMRSSVRSRSAPPSKIKGLAIFANPLLYVKDEPFQYKTEGGAVMKKRGVIIVSTIFFGSLFLPPFVAAESSGLKEDVKETVGGVKQGVGEIGSGIKEGAGQVGKGVKEGTQEIGTETKKVVKDVGQGFKQGAKDVEEGFKEGMKDTKK